MIDKGRLGGCAGQDNGMAAIVLGLCPAAAVSVRVIDSLWMSLGLIVVIVLSSLCIGLVARLGRGAGSVPRGDVPSRRWLGALTLSSLITASFEIALLALAPEESGTLGIYVPIIAVNCLVLGHLESAGRSDSLGRAVSSAARSGLVFAACLIVVTLVREVLGSGTITLFPVGSFGGTLAVGTLSRDPARALGLAGGGLICLGYLAALLRMSRRDRSVTPETAGAAAGAASVAAAKDGDA